MIIQFKSSQRCCDKIFLEHAHKWKKIKNSKILKKIPEKSSRIWNKVLTQLILFNKGICHKNNLVYCYPALLFYTIINLRFTVVGNMHIIYQHYNILFNLLSWDPSPPHTFTSKPLILYFAFTLMTFQCGHNKEIMRHYRRDILNLSLL